MELQSVEAYSLEVGSSTKGQLSEEEVKDVG